MRLSPLFLIFIDDPDFDGVVCRGFVLASRPMLLQDIFDKILPNVAIRRCTRHVEKHHDTAVQQRTTVMARPGGGAFSGINWMGNLGEAMGDQSRDLWERSPQDQEKFWVSYLRDFISLIGLLIALM